MSDSKGKGKAEASKEDEAGTSTSSAANTINKLLSNVASSATGLAKSAFAAPSSNELSNTSSSSVLGAGKVQPSSSGAAGSSAYTESSKPTTSASSYAGQSQATQPQSLRSHQADHASAAETEFSSFLDTIPPMESDTFSMEPLDGQYTAVSQPSPSSYPGTGTDYPHPSSRTIPRTPPTTTSTTSSNITLYNTVQEAQQHDGAAVLDILGRLDKEEKDYFEPQTIEQEIEEWRLTKDQIALAKQLAAELHVPSTDNEAAMIPRAFQNNEKAEYLHEEYAFDSHSHLGEVLPSGEAKAKWIEQWEEVLNRYQDEVWGGMAHLVKEAKQEIQEAKVEGNEGREQKAVRRLGMVLSHLSAAHFSHTQAPESEVVSVPGRETKTVPAPLSESIPVPEAATEQQRRRPMWHWTKQEEIKHREAMGIPPPSPANTPEAFQRQLEIMNAQTKRRQEPITRGDTNNSTFLLRLPDGESGKGEGEGESRQWKDEYPRAYNDTLPVLDPKKENLAKSLDRVFGGW